MSQKYIFRKERARSDPYRVLILLVLVVGGLFILRGFQRQEIQPLFLPTPTPTRTSHSYALEGQTHFQAGNLDKAIAAYQQALQTDPSNALLWAELAQIQTYSSNLLTTREEQRARLNEALQSAEKAVELAPDDSTAHAVRALTLDWNATATDDANERQRLLVAAEQAATRALQLDKNNVLALAYAAEIYNDEQKWDLAQQSIQLAVERNPNLMDVQRVLANIRETQGDYRGAIDAYEKAISISPNLTFLYINVGIIYRHLKVYDVALDYFAKAVNLNKQLGIEDPVPYIAIGKVYTQMGEFFIASLNMKRALQINPYSPDLYGQLGMVYFKARNYESAIPALQCATLGCDDKTSCEVRECNPATDPPIEIKGIPLTENDVGTAVYYYTYGSVLAGLYRPVGKTSGYCNQALEVFSVVRSKFSNDETIMNIVNASEEICASFGITRSVP
ncbi:MAG TPA: tetratricopeptide repeat protein [Anaerolinea thermolimosa]|uniref:Tetratricopeptide repeat protein n=1 Tax=Anaerolinea thermolimosa TaxID=229919 RepID=A0A3D1JD26_9CHLR|nr:tetratricopeptide repeat protein [Anaerolinea thermolimosa]GAP08255.1 tfp pilus assembly protein PilF [Anaerolinea thermolimosa]HCE16432.1 tetratricopeptide repeat protein [Anaerolinea thermolimosa]